MFDKSGFLAQKKGLSSPENAPPDLTDHNLGVIIESCISVAKMPNNPSGRAISG